MMTSQPHLNGWLDSEAIWMGQISDSVSLSVSNWLINETWTLICSLLLFSIRDLTFWVETLMSMFSSSGFTSSEVDRKKEKERELDLVLIHFIGLIKIVTFFQIKTEET